MGKHLGISRTFLCLVFMVEDLDVILACMAIFLPLVLHTSMSHMLYTYLHTQSSQYAYEIGIIIPALQVRKLRFIEERP